MWTCSSRSLLLASTVLPALAATAADGDMPRTQVSTNLNRFSLHARFGFNIKARFQSAATGPRTAVGNPTAGVDHNYDDGYVRVDRTANNGGVTWYWGYENPAQVVGNTIEFHSLASTGNGQTGDVDSDPQYGAELVYQRQLGTIGDDLRWGLEAGLGWSPISISDRGALPGGVTQITDAYAFAPGTTPPAAPYAGSFNGPGFLLFDAPTRSSAPLASSSLGGSREFDADLFSLRLGPSLEIPLGRHAMLGLSGGLALGQLQADYRWHQTLAGQDAGSGSGSDSDFLVGVYAGLSCLWAFDQHWSAHLGAQIQSLGEYSHSFEGAKVSLDLSQMVWVSVGLGYSF